MRAAEVRFGFTVDGAVLRDSEFVDQDAFDVGTHDSAHRVHQDSRLFTLARIQVRGNRLEEEEEEEEVEEIERMKVREGNREWTLCKPVRV